MPDALKTERLTVDGQTFSALTAGDPEKPLILCLHGFPEYSGAFEDILPFLAGEYFCVAPDQRGYGGSWKPAEVAAYAMSELMADAAAMIAHFGRGKPAAAVIGHDWGAAVAYALAFRHADKFERLVIANGVHPVPFQNALAAGGAQSAASQYIEWLRADGSESALVAEDHARMFRIFSENMDMSWMTPEKRQGYRDAWGDVDGVRGMVNWYRASALKVAKPGVPLTPDALPRLNPKHLRVSMPHLLLWGLEDTALLPEARQEIERFCDNIEIHEIEGADHWLLHQQPERVARLVLDFLARP